MFTKEILFDYAKATGKTVEVSVSKWGTVMYGIQNSEHVFFWFTQMIDSSDLICDHIYSRNTGSSYKSYDRFFSFFQKIEKKLAKIKQKK